MTELPRFQILTSSKEEFADIFSKLVKMGFVYSHERCKTMEEITHHHDYYPVILIGCEYSCKMILHGRGTLRQDYRYQTITFEDFLANHWKDYDAINYTP